MNATAESSERQNPPLFDRVLTIDEVCQILGIAKRTFYDNTSLRRLVVNISARRRGVRQSVLEAYLASREAA